MNDIKTIIDPVFGFINVPRGLLLQIVKHPLMQRLSRIKQLGMASVVYPGAQHTRFQHSLGVQAAILMHDIGHGPFSHVLENTLIHGISHEEISLMMMDLINKEMGGELTLAIKIFRDEYPKRFLHQLISSQLDMDRLDYLRRDSFFTGVTEGNIGSARIIKMLNVVDDQLVIDYKGIYSIENYLTSRRLMYWQVYLHKTTVACEKVLVNALLRAKKLASEGVELFASPALHYFLYNDVDAAHFHTDSEALKHYVNLDDNDIWSAVKVWKDSDDKVLALLSNDLIERRPFRVEIHDEEVSDERIAELRKELAEHFGITPEDAWFLISLNTIQKDMYDIHDDHISILNKDNTLKDIAEASEILNVELLSKKIRKYYLCYQRM